MDETTWTRPEARLTVKDAAERYLQHLEGLGRKPTTITDYRSYLTVQLEPFFGDGRLRRSPRAMCRRS